MDNYDLRIIHCADLHLDSKMESNLPKEKAEERKKELLQSFIDMVNYAVLNNVKIIIIAGDLFDTANTQQIRIKRQISSIIEQNSEIDFIYLRGNHDKNDIFSSTGCRPKNLKCFENKWESFKYDNIVIAGRELNGKVSDSVYDNLNLDPSNLNIVVLHGQVSVYNGKDDAPLINLRKLANKNIDYLALGHIHSYQKEKLDSRGSWCYSGCLEGRGFDECGEKGFVLLELNKKQINQSFIPCGKRSIHCMNVELKGSMSYKEIIDKIKQETCSVPKEDLLKVVLTGDISEETAIDTSGYLQLLERNFYFLKIEDKTQTEIDYNKYEKDISLKGEFVRHVKAQDISEEEKTRIILTGLKALAGRELESITEFSPLSTIGSME